VKIWLLQDYLRSGGTERQTILLAKGFATAGHAAALVTFRPGGALATTLAPLVPRVLQPFDTKLNWFAPGLLSAARAAAPDVILCMGRMANCHAGRLARALPETSVVATMRTGKALPSAFIRSLSFVSHIVANSRESAAILASRHGVPTAKLSVIANALVFPAASVPQTDRPLRAALGAGAHTVVMLCVGMFRPEKNQAALIRAAAGLAALKTTLPDWQLWLVGEGAERAVCERLVASLGLGARVRFLGFRPDPANAYDSADLAVLASGAESLSNFLIEAQSHGLPVVAVEVGGVRECCLPGLTGEVTPAGNDEAFISALVRWLTDTERRRRAAPLARAFARESFNPQRQAGKYLVLFETLRGGLK